MIDQSGIARVIMLNAILSNTSYIPVFVKKHYNAEV